MIQSRLDNDFYNFTMGQLIHRFYPDVEVEYAFRNRTFSVPLAERIDRRELEYEIDRVQGLTFSLSDLDYLADELIFEGDYLSWLRYGHKLPDVRIGNDHGHLTLTYKGKWADAVFWETPLLAIVSELYYRRFGGEVEGRQRLREKLHYLDAHPQLQFIEFGSRRRHSLGWQAKVMSELVGLPNLVGTSNAALARQHNVPVVGTMAHQLFMVVSALRLDHQQEWEHPIQAAHDEVYRHWNNLYGAHPKLMTYLPDTYGSDFGLAALDEDDFARFGAIRQDSGDPFEIGQMILDRWEFLGIDPKDKTIVFSDGLDLRTMNLLWDHFNERTNVRFGWGTNLTNDLGFEPLSIVIKPDGVWQDNVRLPCVKLSDNVAKATGPAEAIEEYKQAVAYGGTYTKGTTY